MSSSTAETSAATPPTAANDGDMKIALSYCRFDSEASVFHLRGWIAPAHSKLAVAVEAPGLGRMTQEPLNELRADAPAGDGPFNGFKLRVPAPSPVEKLKLVVLDDGVTTKTKWVTPEPIEEVVLFSCAYHDDLKMLKLVGGLTARSMVSAVSLIKTTGEYVPIPEIGLDLDELVGREAREASNALRYAGFSFETIASLGELRGARLVVQYGDGQIVEQSLPDFMQAGQTNEALELGARISFLDQWVELTATAVFHGPVRDACFTFDGEPARTMLTTVGTLKDYKKTFRSRSETLRSVSVKGPFDAVFPRLADGVAPTRIGVRIDGFDGEVCEYERVLKAAEVVEDRLLFGTYQRSGGMVSVVGHSASARGAPKTVSIVRQGGSIGTGTVEQTADLWTPNATIWRADVRVNGDLSRDGALGVDIDGVARVGVSQPQLITRAELMDGTDAKSVVERIEPLRRALMTSPRPRAVLFVPNDLRTLAGGAASRIDATVEYLQHQGFFTIAIDRSSLLTNRRLDGQISRTPTIADVYFPLPQYGLSAALAEAVARFKGGELDPALAAAAEAAAKGKARVVDPTSLIKTREDVAFNFMSMVIADLVLADVTVGNYAWSTSAFGLRRRGAEIVDIHDIQAARSDEFARMTAESPYVDGLSPDITQETVANEVSYLRRADIVVTMSDAEFLRLAGDLEVQNLSCAPIAGRLAPPPRDVERAPVGVFVGGGYAPNADALGRLLEILPAIRAKVPNFELHVVGDIAQQLELEGRDGVVALGRVDDLTTVYARAGVALNPSIYGTGQPVKTVEAVGAGLRVIATEHGARGCADLVAADAVWVREVDDFPTAIAEALSAPALSIERLGAMARFKLAENYAMLGKQINKQLFNF